VSPADPGLYPAQAYAARAAGPVDVRVIPGCDHFCAGLEDQIGQTAAGWIGNVLAGAGGSGEGA